MTTILQILLITLIVLLVMIGLALGLQAAGQPDWVSGACLLVRRVAAEQAGLLDERFFIYAEDVDFCAAVRAHGHKVRFTPAAQIVHHRGRSVATNRSLVDAAYRRSQIAFYEKHHPAWAPWLRAYLRLRGKLPPAVL